MLKKKSLTRKKLSEAKDNESDEVPSNLDHNFSPPPFRVKTILPAVDPEPTSQTQLKTTFQIHQERMKAAEELLGSSMSSVSKDFIGTTSTKIWSPFEHRSRYNEIDVRAKYRVQIELRKAAQQLKELTESANARLTKSGQKIKVVPVTMAKVYRKLEPNQGKTPKPNQGKTPKPKRSLSTRTPAAKPLYGPDQKSPLATDRKRKELRSLTTRTPAAKPVYCPDQKSPLATDRKRNELGSFYTRAPAAKPVYGPDQKSPLSTDRKRKELPTTPRKALLNTFRKAPATDPKAPVVSERKVPATPKGKPADKIVILGTKQKKKAEINLETIFGNEEASATIEDTQGPKEKKVVTAKKVKGKDGSVGDVPESSESESAFAAVLKRSPLIPALRKNSLTGSKMRVTRKSVTSMGVQDLSIIQGYAHFASEGTGFRNNTFANPRDTRKSSGGDAINSLDRFQVDVNMEGFDNDEIFFQTDDTSLVVTGLRPKKLSINARKVTEVVEFPNGVYPESIRISRNVNGVLTVEQY